MADFWKINAALSVQRKKNHYEIIYETLILISIEVGDWIESIETLSTLRRRRHYYAITKLKLEKLVTRWALNWFTGLCKYKIRIGYNIIYNYSFVCLYHVLI